MVCSLRHIVLPDGTQLAQLDPEDAEREHVDTSCFLFTVERRFLASLWCRMPKFCGPICDRVMFGLAQQFDSVEHTGKQTVFFESNYGVHYRMAGKPEPEKLNDIAPAIWDRIYRPDHATRTEFWSRTGHFWPF